MAQEKFAKSLKYRIRQAVKSLAVKGGGLSLFHRVKHRETLTVLMFHRVLPPYLMTGPAMDEEYTISADLLQNILAFAALHYNIVSLDEVLKSRQRLAPLPAYPLLITFDDGWSDNAIYAAPIFAERGTPWTLFAATDAISSGPRWWQETLLKALRSKHVTYQDVWAAGLAAAGHPEVAFSRDPILAVLQLYGLLPGEQRETVIADFCGMEIASPTARDMVDWEGLRALKNAGVSIGGHGASHLPLTLIKDPRADLREAQTMMNRQLGAPCRTMSFPHGLYNPVVMAEARQTGMELLFTSDPVLNKCPAGWLQSDIIGRISISSDAVADARGVLNAEHAMPWLMLRP